MNEVKSYITFLIGWITGHSDIELEPETEFEVVRVIMDSYDCWKTEEQKGETE